MVKSASNSRSASTTLRKSAEKSHSIRRQAQEDGGVKELLTKLQSILPTSNGELSTLDIMQHAIYYIQDLTEILEKTDGESSSNESEDEKENKGSFPSVFSSGKSSHFNPSSQPSFRPTPVC